MALDAATLALVAGELRETLADSRVDKVYQPTRDEVVLTMRSRVATHRLLLSARSGSARVCLTGESYENPVTPPSFCMLLRKHLLGGRLMDVRPLAGDRIVFFDFQCTNEMGDLVLNTLAAELMGRYCNLVLIGTLGTQEGQAMPHAAYTTSQEYRQAGVRSVPGRRIIDALKRVDFEDSEVRQLLPGLPYTLPPQPERLDFLHAPFAQMQAAAMQSDAPIDSALRKIVANVGPVVVREAVFRAFAGSEHPASSLTATQWQALQAAMQAIRDDYAAGGRPNLVKNAEGQPVEFSFTPLTQYASQYPPVFYDSFSALLEGYYAEKDRVERLRQKSKVLRKTVHNLHERAQRKQAARLEELAASETSEHLRIFGELLTANLHRFAKGDSEITVENWYENGALVTIPLDVRIGPSANAQRYFKEYKKKQTAAKMLHQLLKNGENEIAYLATVLYEVDTAAGEQALGEIRAELKAQGYLKYYKLRDKKQKPAGFMRYRSSDGFLVQVGRNNAQNDQLTLKNARGKDMWFHTKNAPGSHVVVMSEGQDIPLDTMNQAAMLAVVHSSQKNSAKVAVDYTQVKNIRKTADLPPGMVLYEHYETAYITPQAEILAKIKAE